MTLSSGDLRQALESEGDCTWSSLCYSKLEFIEFSKRPESPFSLALSACLSLYFRDTSPTIILDLSLIPLGLLSIISSSIFLL